MDTFTISMKMANLVSHFMNKKRDYIDLKLEREYNLELQNLLIQIKKQKESFIILIILNTVEDMITSKFVDWIHENSTVKRS